MKTDDQASNQTSSAEKSRLRYQSERLNKNIKSLTVIDNEPLRQFEIKNAKAWFRKIDQLEKSIFTFQ